MYLLDNNDMPVGFGMALAQNMAAMERYSGLTEAKKEELLNRARDAKSKSDIDSIIAELNGFGTEGGRLI